MRQATVAHDHIRRRNRIHLVQTAAASDVVPLLVRLAGRPRRRTPRCRAAQHRVEVEVDDDCPATAQLSPLQKLPSTITVTRRVLPFGNGGWRPWRVIYRRGSPWLRRVTQSTIATTRPRSVKDTSPFAQGQRSTWLLRETIISGSHSRSAISAAPPVVRRAGQDSHRRDGHCRQDPQRRLTTGTVTAAFHDEGGRLRRRRQRRRHR